MPVPVTFRSVRCLFAKFCRNPPEFRLNAQPSGGGVDSKLAVISLAFIEVDADVDIKVFVTVVVAAAVVAAMAAAAAATLRVALILFCLLQIVMPSR